MFRHNKFEIVEKEQLTYEGEDIEHLSQEQLIRLVYQLMRDIRRMKADD